MSSLRLFTLMLLFSCVPVLGYKIDASCNKAGVENTVRDAMGSAFEMVDAAIVRLTERKEDWTPETESLVNTLFTKTGNQAKSVNLFKVMNFLTFSHRVVVFQRIRNYYRQETTGDIGDRDVIIYCDDSRLEKVNDQKKTWRDTTVGDYLKYDQVQCKGTIGDFVALAVTRNPVMPEVRGGRTHDAEQTTQIQLCPWFLTWIKNKKFKITKDITSRTSIGKLVIKASEKGRGFKQIDAFSLLDKVLLHEMTHGWSVWKDSDEDGDVQRGLIDVPGAVTIGGKSMIPYYGWKWCKKLANEGELVGERRDLAADNNADSIALFGSVCKLMTGDSPKAVDDDGRIIPIQVPGPNTHAGHRKIRDIDWRLNQMH